MVLLRPGEIRLSTRAMAFEGGKRIVVFENGSSACNGSTPPEETLCREKGSPRCDWQTAASIPASMTLKNPRKAFLKHGGDILPPVAESIVVLPSHLLHILASEGSCKGKRAFRFRPPRPLAIEMGYFPRSGEYIGKTKRSILSGRKNRRQSTHGDHL